MSPSKTTDLPASCPEAPHAPHQPDKSDALRARQWYEKKEVAAETATDVHLTAHPETKALVERLVADAQRFLDKIGDRSEPANKREKTGREKTIQGIEYLRQFFPEFITEQNIRADQVDSAEMKKAADIANELFGQIPQFSFLCVDGRLNLTLEFGFMAGVKGGSIQVPAGDPKEFIKSETENTLFIRPDSNAARQIDRALQSNGDQIVQILDSHLACAAREEREKKLGNPVKDHGLKADVIRKIKIGNAIQDYVDRHHPGKNVMVEHFSFDPHTGYGYMGLETEKAIEKADGEGFTEEILKELTEEETILSTKKMSREEPFRSEFEKAWSAFDPKPDWKRKHKETGIQMWEAIRKMTPRLLPPITEKLLKVYPGIEKNENEIRQRGMMLLANAFNAFCMNREEEYEYAEHGEEVVSVTERDFQPMPIMSFAVNSLDFAKMADHVVFASGIVRDVRKNQGLNGDGLYPDAESFRAAPVPVIVRAIMRGDIHPEDWKDLRDINWDFLSPEWMKWDANEFFDRLITHNSHNKAIRLTAGLFNALNELQKKMACLYAENGECSYLLVRGKLVALPVISDASRRVQAVIPFFLKGFKE